MKSEVRNENSVPASLTFVTSLEAFYRVHHQLVRHLESEITSANNQKAWDAVISYAKIRCKLRHLVVSNRQFFQFERTMHIYNCLSYRWQRDFSEIMSGLFSAFDAYVIGHNFEDLTEVYRDFAALMMIGEIEQRDGYHPFDMLWCRIHLRLLKFYYRRWNR